MQQDLKQEYKTTYILKAYEMHLRTQAESSLLKNTDQLVYSPNLEHVQTDKIISLNIRVVFDRKNEWSQTVRWE